MRFFLLILCISSLIESQNKQLLFGFNEIPQSILINPSTAYEKNVFVGIPLLSQIHLNVGSTGINAFDLFADDGRSFNDKLRDIIYSADKRDFITLNQQLELFSAGFAYGKSFKKTNYLSFGMYLETDLISYFPEDYARLAYEGNANNIGRVFDFSDLNVRGEMLTVFHIGTTKRLNKKLTLGGRLKLYNSIFNVSSINNRGRFVTVRGENNVYNHIFNLNLTANTSGIAPFINDENSNAQEDTVALLKRFLFGGNLGLGFDIGFTLTPTDQLTIEGSLNDIGFIVHSKDIENYRIEGDYEFEGINPLFSGLAPEESPDDYWNNVADEFESIFERDTTTTNYTTLRPIQLNTALRYAFGKRGGHHCHCKKDDVGYLNEIGGQLFAIKRPRGPQFALTGYYYRRLLNALRAKVTYTIDSFSYYNIGLGISSHLGAANFYILADNLLAYRNLAKAHSASFQLGFNLTFASKWK